jgi:4-aminobutyrate aminotransferase
MVAMDLVRPGDPSAPDPELRDEVVQAAFRRGLLLLGCGEAAVRFCPPLCVTAAQVDTALGLLDGILAEVVRGRGAAASVVAPAAGPADAGDAVPPARNASYS